MRRGALLTMLMAMLVAPLAGLRQGVPGDQEAVRPRLAETFDVVHVELDVRDAALAAYQVQITAPPGTMEVVGIEGGDHPEFREPPFYDEKAIQGERVIIGAFSTAGARDLPTGRVRVATIHVLVQDPGVRFESDLQVVATVGGRSIEAEVTLRRGSET